jgi:Protein of unknown function (DUF3828)
MKRFLATCLLLLLSCASLAQQPSSNSGTAKAANETVASCRRFVQSFYDWYKGKAGTNFEAALRDKRSAFDPELFKALQEDIQAQAKVPGEIVGLDFDPIVNSQDPCERYVVGSVTRKGDNYKVQVFGVCSGKKNAKPDVTAELATKDGQWQFTNFHYTYDSGPSSLLAILESPRKEREQHP